MMMMMIMIHDGVKKIARYGEEKTEEGGQHIEIKWKIQKSSAL